ncbi:uncharacterized protein LOC130667950 [Microplitis mediator]|uniref:uncharacterized protein LOC130667950 n=1 Tax=Microplitis mediator TaxID=375433 RepID=UPI002553FD19|nr:uncharacterized protein LOC130667950 [Microplitis mediator]
MAGTYLWVRAFREQKEMKWYENIWVRGLDAPLWEKYKKEFTLPEETEEDPQAADKYVMVNSCENPALIGDVLNFLSENGYHVVSSLGVYEDSVWTLYKKK